MRHFFQSHDTLVEIHDDVIEWKHFPRYWPFMRGIHRSPVKSPHKGQWSRVLMLSLIYTWRNGWVNTSEAGDLRRHRAHYDVIVMKTQTTKEKIRITNWVTSFMLDKLHVMHLYNVPAVDTIFVTLIKSPSEAGTCYNILIRKCHFGQIFVEWLHRKLLLCELPSQPQPKVSSEGNILVWNY